MNRATIGVLFLTLVTISQQNLCAASSGCRIRKIGADGVINTIAGVSSATAPILDGPASSLRPTSMASPFLATGILPASVGTGSAPIVVSVGDIPTSRLVTVAIH